MEKPVTVKVEELRGKFKNAINESELPAFLVEMILGEVLTGISQISAREYAQNFEEWEEAQKAGE